MAIPPSPGEFPETRWSAISAVRRPDDPTRRQRFEELCRAYWSPVCAYFRRARGHAAEEAEDLTQEFFVHLLTSPLLERADPSRARFRTYLKSCLSNFSAKDREAKGRLKRGGGKRPLSIEGRGEEEDPLAIADPLAEDPAAALDVEWRQILVERAVGAIDEKAAGRGREQAAEIFRAYYLAGEEERPTYAVLSERFGVAPSDLVNLLYRSRRIFKASILDQIRDSTASEEETRLEYRELFGEDP